MNDWTPPAKPHENHPSFPFHPTERNPVKDGKPKLGKERPPLSADPGTPEGQFEAMCAILLGLIDDFNAATMGCKVGGSAAAILAAKDSYDGAVFALNEFMGSSDAPNPGYQSFVKPGSFNIEVVTSHGFVVGARIFGLPLDQMQMQMQAEGGEREPASSSSYYSIYP